MAKNIKHGLVETSNSKPDLPVQDNKDLSTVITSMTYMELLTGKMTMDHAVIADIVDMARQGHPQARQQLLHAIVGAMERDCFQELPLAVRAYAIHLLVFG
jgi:hypothetical protein